MEFVRDIKINGGVHNNCHAEHMADMTEAQLKELLVSLSEAMTLAVPTRCAAWIEVTYTKSIGSKIHS